jgi:hypothetical protein
LVELYVDRKNILCVMFLGGVEDILASEREQETGEYCVMRNFMFSTAHIEECGRGVACCRNTRTDRFEDEV